MRILWAKGSLLTETNFSICVLLLFVVSLSACHGPEKEKLPSGGLIGKIIYDTYLINRDTTDTWGNECLAGFNRGGLIDKIFASVYDKKITPYDYFTGMEILPEQIMKMEKEGIFTRKEISKIQFEEQWVWDNPNATLHKELISMTIAYEVYNNMGISRGQKPIFKLIFKK